MINSRDKYVTSALGWKLSFAQFDADDLQDLLADEFGEEEEEAKRFTRGLRALREEVAEAEKQAKAAKEATAKAAAKANKPKVPMLEAWQTLQDQLRAKAELDRTNSEDELAREVAKLKEEIVQLREGNGALKGG
eukprot:COSAG04_NODE_2049_length_4917_cov_3.895600_3_plen_135_part_00